MNKEIKKEIVGFNDRLLDLNYPRGSVVDKLNKIIMC